MRRPQNLNCWGSYRAVTYHPSQYFVVLCRLSTSRINSSRLQRSDSLPALVDLRSSRSSLAQAVADNSRSLMSGRTTCYKGERIGVFLGIRVKPSRAELAEPSLPIGGQAITQKVNKQNKGGMAWNTVLQRCSFMLLDISIDSHTVLCTAAAPTSVFAGSSLLRK